MGGVEFCITNLETSSQPPGISKSVRFSLNLNTKTHVEYTRRFVQPPHVVLIHCGKALQLKLSLTLDLLRVCLPSLVRQTTKS